MTSIPEAETLIAFFQLKDHFTKLRYDVSEVTLDEWTGSSFLDSVIFSPVNAGNSNRLYMVREGKVYDFNPLQISLSEAYATLFEESNR